MFSVKSNNNIKILNEMSKFGIGADVVSKGELMAALKSKINPKKLYFQVLEKLMKKLSLLLKIKYF